MNLIEVRELGNKIWNSCQKDKRVICNLTHNDWDEILIKAGKNGGENETKNYIFKDVL